jgi:hypothetical protein
MSVLAVFIAYPWVALIVAAGFGVVWFRRRRRSIALAAMLWAGYAAYEYLMYARILCTRECNIRVDLLLLFPVLMLVSIWAAVAALQKRALGR